MRKSIFISLTFLISIIAIIAFSGLINVGVITYDDLTNKLFAINRDNNLFKIAHSFAKGQGRFFFEYSGHLLFLPYLWDNLIYTKVMSILPILINIALFGVLLRKLFDSSKLSWTVILLFFAFMQNSWEHNLLVAYPFVFTTSFSFTLIGIMLLLKYLDSKKIAWNTLSAVCFFISLLTYETFLVYFIFFIVLFLKKNLKSNISRAQVFLSTLNDAKYHIFAVILYFSLYFFFQQKYPAGGYDGNILGKLDLPNYFKTIFQLGTSSLPGYIYLNKLYAGFVTTQSYSLTGDKRNPIFILQNLQVMWVIKALIVSYCVYLISGLKEKKIGKTSLLIILLVSILLIFLPQLIISLTQKYQSWVISGSIIGFTTTYFSYFGSILLIATLVNFATESFKSELLKKLSLFILLVGVSLISVATDYSNYHVNMSQSQTTLMWNVITPFLQTQEFSAIQNDSIIYSPNLNTYFTYKGYWDKFVKIKTKKNIVFYTNSEDFKKSYLDAPEKFNDKLYYLGYYQEDKDKDAYITLSKVKRIVNDEGVFRIYSDSADIYTYSKYRKYINQYKTVGEVAAPPYKSFVDTRELLSSDGYFTYLVNKEFPGELLLKTKIDAHEIDVQSILVSYFNNFNSAIK